MNKRVKDDAYHREKFSLTSLAIPMLAGPDSISLFNRDVSGIGDFSGKSYYPCSNIRRLFSNLNSFKKRTLFGKILGASGINTITRIIGFIVIA